MKNKYSILLVILVLFLIINRSSYTGSSSVGTCSGQFSIGDCPAAPPCGTGLVTNKTLLAFGAGENMIYKYSPYTNTWTKLQNTPQGIQYYLFSVGDVIFGDNKASRYYPLTETWTDSFDYQDSTDMGSSPIIFSVGNTIFRNKDKIAHTYVPSINSELKTKLNNSFDFPNSYIGVVNHTLYPVVNDNIFMVNDGRYVIYDKASKTFSDVQQGPSIEGLNRPDRAAPDRGAYWTCALRNMAILGYGLISKYNSDSNSWSNPIQVPELYLDDDYWSYTADDTIISFGGEIATYNPENDSWTRQNPIPFVPGTTQLISTIMSF
jgi:hypothetical protein